MGQGAPSAIKRGPVAMVTPGKTDPDVTIGVDLSEGQGRHVTPSL